MSENGSDRPARPRANIVFLGSKPDFNVDQALAEAAQFHGRIGLREVLIVGTDNDGDLFIGNSHMSREWALWLLMELTDYVRSTGRHVPQTED